MTAQDRAVRAATIFNANSESHFPGRPLFESLVENAIEEAVAEVRLRTVIPAEWLVVASQLLDLAHGQFSNNSCNDWSWPEEWSEQQRIELATQMVAQNVHRPVDGLKDADREEIARLVDYSPPNWWVMLFLGRLLAATSGPTAE